MFEKYDSIYIYGYNNWGRNVYNKVKALYPQKDITILVPKMEQRKIDSIIGKKIIELANVKSSEKDLIILELNPINQGWELRELQERGFEHVIIYSHAVDDFLNNSLGSLPKIEVGFLGVCVGQACNLRCRDCANFAPYAHKENRKYRIENIKRDLEKLFLCMREVDIFHIQGGEPFLYLELDQLLFYVKENYGHIIKNMQVATNGTVIPSQKVLDVMSETKTLVRISNYPIESKVDELITLLEHNNISYRIYNFVNKTGEWSDTGKLDYLIPKERDVVRQMFECGWNKCFTVENGLVGRCARSIPALTLQDLPKREKDYINLSKELDMKKVHKYFTITSPMACCMHCNGSSGEGIKPAVQI